jgi:hypothetical protein
LSNAGIKKGKILPGMGDGASLAGRYTCESRSIDSGRLARTTFVFEFLVFHRNNGCHWVLRHRIIRVFVNYLKNPGWTGFHASAAGIAPLSVYGYEIVSGPVAISVVS